MDQYPGKVHVETVVLMSRVEGKYPQKPSNTAVFGLSGKLGVWQDERFSVIYPRANQLKKCES